jgi:hypothetical protein
MNSNSPCIFDLIIYGILILVAIYICILCIFGDGGEKDNNY